MNKEEKRNALLMAHLIMDNYDDRKMWEHVKYPTWVSVKKEYIKFDIVDDDLINWALEKEQQKFTVQFDEDTNASHWYKIYHTEL